MPGRLFDNGFPRQVASHQSLKGGCLCIERCGCNSVCDYSNPPHGSVLYSTWTALVTSMG